MTRNRQVVRQLILLRELLAGGRAGRTLEYLAVALAVTSRTIRRDIAALEEAHLPVVTGRRDDDGVTVYGLTCHACPTCGQSVRRGVAA